MRSAMSVAVLSAVVLLGGWALNAGTPEGAGAGAPGQPVAPPGHRDGAAILAVSHDRERGITSITVSAGALPPCARINVFRNSSPITEDDLRFCPQVASVTRDKSACSIPSPDSGEFYYALTTSDEYGRQDKKLLRQTRVGPVLETCRTPPPPPSPWRSCTKGQTFLCWTSDPGASAVKYQVYQRQAAGRSRVGSVPIPDTSGLVSYAVPVPLANDHDYRFTVTAVNSSGLESRESAPVHVALLPDLEVASGATIARNRDFSIAKMFPIVGKPVRMSVTIHNRGLVAARGVGVSVYAYHPASHTSSVLLEQSVDIAPDDAVTPEFTWTPERLGEYQLKLVVDESNRIAEIDKGNNQATVLVPVVKRDVYIAWYGDPLHANWCNVANSRPTDIQEWKRRGAVAAFVGMVGKNEAPYRKQIQAGFNGVEVDEIGGYDAAAAEFIGWLTGLKTDHPEFFIALWMAGSATPEMARNDQIDLYLGENYYNIGTPPKFFDVHIKHARDLGICGKFIFGLGAGIEQACRLAHTHSINEEVAFLEQEMKYIAENAPEMPGIALYGSRPGMNEKVDDLCYRYFVEPQFTGDQP